MSYSIIQEGESRSFPEGDPFLMNASGEGGDVLVCIGDISGIDLRSVMAGKQDRHAVLLELGSECLGVHIGETEEDRPENVLGFARYRTGASKPSQLVELVRPNNCSQQALAAARELFEEAGFEVVVCTDQAGRIIDRLVRPKYNAALRLLDEGLATVEAMDLTCRLGLGYPDGPIERVRAGGLADHYRICRNLFEVYGSPAYAPARAAVVAARRKEQGK